MIHIKFTVTISAEMLVDDSTASADPKTRALQIEEMHSRILYHIQNNDVHKGLSMMRAHVTGTSIKTNL
jgi:hypothetical protein